MIKKMLSAIMAFLLFMAVAFAQNTTVTGKVTDENGAPIVGVTVLVKGEKTGVNTDATGNFSI